MNKTKDAGRAPADAVVTGQPPAITHGDRRPVSEIWPESICGCGRKVRYIAVHGDTTKDACNKYGRCMSWDELKAKHDALLEVVGKAIRELDVCYQWADGAMKNQIGITRDALEKVLSR